MHPHKALGPDGMNLFFCQKVWNVISGDVFAIVLAILDGHAIPPKLNHTFVTLIPKKSQLEHITDVRSISLCNMAYKLVTKVIANCLKSFLLTIISNTQGAFTQGRLISDNILMAFEILHTMRGDASSNGSMAIKLDMSKAYDRVEWAFLSRAMLKLGFRP